MSSKYLQVSGSVVGGFLFGAVFWACSAPAPVTAAGECECASDLTALEARIAVLEAAAADSDALEARLATLEESSVTQSDGEASIPASAADGAEGGQLNLVGATSFGVGYNVDVYHDAFRVIRAPEDGGAGVVFGWDGATDTFVVYGDVNVSGTVTASAFVPG